MGKSVYSVVLSDQVVAAIDKLAYAEGTSRSKLIDRVLAQYAGCDTPGQRMTDIFSCIEQMAGLEEQFRLLINPSDELLQLKSAVPYKYNPTVKYAVELYENDPTALGELRVSMRTQSRPLLAVLGRFFLLWVQLEEQSFQDGSYLSFEVADGKYTRQLRYLPGASSAQLGEAIAGYIKLFDRVLHLYFDALGSGEEEARRRAAAGFRAGLTAPVARL